MKSINKLLVGLGLTAVCFMAASSSTYAAVAGHVQFVSGNVQISNAEGLSRSAQKGDAINEGDMLTSAQKSSAQIKMQDGGFIAMRPGSRMKFDQYRFSGQADGTERNFFSLFKGGFRAVTGLIGRVNKQNYRVTTPAATIGIRGTDYEVSVVETASAKLAYADLPLLAESDITPPTTGPMSTTYAAVNRPGDAIEVSNQFGKVRVDNVGIMARVQFNQSPVIESRRQELFSSATLKSGVKVGKKEGKEEAKPETAAEDSAAAEATQDSGTQGDGESVRETAPVDAAPPATGGAPAANASTISDTTAVVATNNQNAPTNVVAADGTQFNTSAGTATTPGGQVITPTQGTVAPPVNADLYAYEVVAAMGAAGAYSIVNPWGGAMPNTAFALSTANELVSAANASLKDSFSGGTALDVWKSADSSIYMGRWQGGSITTTDLAGATVGVPVVLGAGSAHWIVSAQTPLNYVQTLAGTNTYTLVAATAPTDAMGNVGTLLNTSVITANFSTQLVNVALNIQFPSKLFAVTTPAGIYIVGDTIWGMGAVACTGANCAAVGYNADLWARFSGTTASNVALAYHLIAGTTGVSTDLIQGVAAFNSATPPTVPPPIVVQPYVQTDVSFELSVGNWFGYLPMYYGGGGMTAAANVAPAAATPSFSWSEGCLGCGIYAVTLPGATGAVNGNATSFAMTGIQFGRWTNAPTLSQVSSSIAFGPGKNNTGYGAASWAFAPEGYLDTPTTLSSATGGTTIGVFSYALNGAPAPKDNTGATGTLNSLSLTADFTTQTVTAALSASMGATSWSASSATPMAIGAFNGTSAGFSGSLNVTSNNASVITNGYLNGAFTGQNYAGAIVDYSIQEWSPTGGAMTANVSGVAALTRNGVAGNATVVNGGTPATGKFVVAEAGTTGWWNLQSVDVVTTTGGVLTSYGYNTGNTSTTTISCITCTGQAAADTATGIQFGTWDEGTRANSYTTPFGGQFHWIRGPGLNPIYLPEVLLGNMSYTLDGGTAPTNQSGLTGTLSSASLTVNFTNQTVDLALGLTSVNGHNWSANATGVPLSWTNYSKNGFWANTGTALLANDLIVAMDGVSAGASGSVTGQLTGSGLNGALFEYQLMAPTTLSTPLETVNGVVALVTATPANPATPYRLVGMSAYDPTAMVYSGNLRTDGGYNNATRVTEVAGGVTAFDAGFNANSMIYTRGSSSFAIGTATQTGLGTDPVTGISWGRWVGGMVDITDRATGAVTPSALGTSSLHWIATPSMTAPVALPTTGTYTYVLAGGTAPTDNLGNIGTLNSASLVANFTSQTVDVGVNVGISNTAGAAATLVASGTGIPIQQASFFRAQTYATTGTASQLTTSCTGAGCATPTPGAIINGAFTGATGAGAGMIYGFSNGSTVVNGVAAFHR